MKTPTSLSWQLRPEGWLSRDWGSVFLRKDEDDGWVSGGSFNGPKSKKEGLELLAHVETIAEKLNSGAHLDVVLGPEVSQLPGFGEGSCITCAAPIRNGCCSRHQHAVSS